LQENSSIFFLLRFSFNISRLTWPGKSDSASVEIVADIIGGELPSAFVGVVFIKSAGKLVREVVERPLASCSSSSPESQYWRDLDFRC
jgi:hypothetical protein